MIVSGKSDHQVIADALEHFARILNDLQYDKEVRVGNGVMRMDLKENAEKAKELAIQVRSKNHDLKFVHNLPLVCNALVRYSNDLQASRSSQNQVIQGTS